MAATSKHTSWQPAEVNALEMMYRAGMSLWYSLAIGSAVALGGALVAIFGKHWRE